MTPGAKRTLRVVATLALLILIVYFYSLQVLDNWAALQNFRLEFKLHYLASALILYLAGYLLDTYAWQVCMNRGRRGIDLDFPQSLAVLHGSGLMKYLPGRIWSYTAQLVWLRKYGFGAPVILFVNLISILGSMFVSVCFGLIYLAAYLSRLSLATAALAFLVLVLLNLAFIKWNTPVMNRIIALVSRLLKKEIEPVQNSSSLIIIMEIAHTGSWALVAAGAYLLGRGIGVDIPAAQTFALLSSMAVSWVAGYVAFILPAGLGVRELIMLSMLQGVVDPRTALLFPVLTRLMDLLAVVVLGLLSLYIGVKRGVFASAPISEAK